MMFISDAGIVFIDVEDAVGLAEACCRAGRPEMIASLLRRGASLDDAARALAAPSAPPAAPPPARTAPAPSAPISSFADPRLQEIGRRRFAAQAGRAA